MADPFPTGYLNGEYLPPAAARISPFDRGFLFGDGVYEVVPVHRGRPFLLRAHLDRLARSLAAIRLANPHTHEQWAEIVAELASRAGAPEQLVYLQVTRGAERGRNHLFPTGVAPTVFGFTAPYPAPSPELLAQGSPRSPARTSAGRAATSSRSRCSRMCCCGRRPATRAAPRRCCCATGWLTEGSSSTVFVVQGDRLMTPPNEPRSCPARRAKPCSSSPRAIAQEIRPVTAAELATADEVWIASAGRGVLPVTSLDGRAVGSGQPGPHWQRTYAALQAHLDAIAATPAA